ncbi:hypothetical protein M595_5030 [Lyngbya aestuarii BL J]|uniref:Uncharacterized protein n=1 Tax=Lyngbya aestuarii BL J TaxID=1348334 RepID=U7QAZ0_9CYAN|nr:hypothetical protein M595_5030 [Lyngbya aestuarii BL J]
MSLTFWSNYDVNVSKKLLEIKVLKLQPQILKTLTKHTGE